MKIDPSQRLGQGGLKDIKQHAFFSGIDWQMLGQMASKPPYMPPALPREESRFDSFDDMLKELTDGSTLSHKLSPSEDVYFDNWYVV